MILHNACITKLSFYVIVIGCDLGVACFSVHGSYVRCVDCWHCLCKTANNYSMSTFVCVLVCVSVSLHCINEIVTLLN